MNPIATYREHRLALFFAGLVCLVGICSLTFLIRRAIVAARESSCTGHIYKITQALLDYRHAHGHFPGEVAAKDGSPAHSWRVLILPQLGYDDLYRRYDFDLPWNSRTNQIVLRQMPAVFGCPNCAKENCASYFVLPDNDASVLVRECNHPSIFWTEPRDVDTHRPTTEACDPSGFGIGLLDGTISRGSTGSKQRLNAARPLQK